MEEARPSRNREYFRVPSLIWYIIIPLGLLLNFMTWYDVDMLPLEYMSYLGELAYHLGKNYPVGMLMANVAALVAHIAEGAYAKTLCKSLQLSPTATLKWHLQTILLGYPSLSILIKRSNKLA